MKTSKIIVSSLILGSFLFPAFGQIAYAQVDTPATSAQIDDLKATLISLLTQMIASLQAQIDTILAQQATTTTVSTTPVTSGTDIAQAVAPESLRIDEFQFQAVNNPDWQLDVVTNKPIDPTLTQIDGHTITATDVKTLPASVYALPNDYRVRFHMNFEASTTPVVHMTIFGTDGTSVTRDLHYVGSNSVSNYRN